MSEFITKERAMDCVYEAVKTTDANIQDLYAIRRKIANEPGIGWISVRDRLPEKGHIVLVAREYHEPGKKVVRYVETASMYGDNEWVSIEDEYKANKQYHMKPYAWMYLPEPPKEENHEID